MNARDELAAVIENAYDLNEGMVTFELLAHAVLSAGYRKVVEWPACPPRMEGDRPHCPDCSGIVGETGVVW